MQPQIVFTLLHLRYLTIDKVGNFNGHRFCHWSVFSEIKLQVLSFQNIMYVNILMRIFSHSPDTGLVHVRSNNVVYPWTWHRFPITQAWPVLSSYISLLSNLVRFYNTTDFILNMYFQFMKVPVCIGFLLATFSYSLFPKIVISFRSHISIFLFRLCYMGYLLNDREAIYSEDDIKIK